MENESLQLQLGDIIQIEAPTNDIFNEQLFLILYIDSAEIDVQNITSLKKALFKLDDDGNFEDKTVEGISLLSRDKEQGYARQNGLVAKTWVSITFGGDLPAIISGEITNVEEDMIEILTFPEKETIYIDFAYKGIPKDIPIKSIEIREAPDMDLIIDDNEDTLPRPNAKYEMPVPEIKDTIKQVIIQADEITFGPDLGEITQEVAVDDKYERFGIQTQTNDLLDELLSTIPNTQRTTKILNKIHMMIERFKELRNIFSEKDANGNPINPIIKSASYKPLVESLKKLNKNLGWIIPVVKNKKKVYDIDNAEAEMADDVASFTMAEAQIQDTDALASYQNNTTPTGENKYDYLLNAIQDVGTPYEKPDNSDYTDFITKQEVSTDLSVIVDNLDDFYSSIVTKEMLARKRYLIGKYNLGFNKLETVIEQGSKPYNKSVVATPAAKVYLKSFILMPEKAIRQSRVNLPGSSILVKSVLNRDKTPLYKRFTKSSTVNSQTVESFDESIEHNFVEGATEITLDDTLQDDPDKYEKYLQSIIPRTKILFNIIKKYIDAKLTLCEVVKEMEPFLVYSDDLTYNQYRVMNKFIRKKINDYKKDYVASSREYRFLQSGKKFADKTWYSLFNILTTEKKRVMEDNYGLKMRGFTSSENYHRIMDIDGGRLFMTAMAMENLLLMTPVDINDIFQRERLAISNSKTSTPKENLCSNYALVKRYLELDELLEDNGKSISVDKNLDQTRYDIINEYLVEQSSMNADDFEDFLKKKLETNVGVTPENAVKDAKAMISGKRNVEEGEYAALEIDGGEKTYYYKRVGNEWERDESLPDVKMDEGEFCNIQLPCIKVKDDCATNEIAQDGNEEKSLKSLISEFNIKYEVSKEELTRLIQNRFAFFTYRMKMLKKLRFDEKTKYNDQAIALGNATESFNEDVVISPYVKLRDAILGQPDLVKKNNDILRFHTMFTRDSIEDSDEDKYWFYCKETNQKLIPIFIITLAKTFIENQYNYVKVLDQICANQGKLSDDGNAWVDEHSGYVIKQVSFDTDEGYEETGFKAASREIIQDDLRTIRKDELQRKFSDPNAEKINNVIQALGSYMGVSVVSMQEFVIRNTLLITSRIVPSEAEYNKKREALSKKGKKIPTFDDAYNTSMMIVALAFFLVGIQTSIPSIKTRKQFPGCKKSFDGFPMDGSGDDSAIQYVACVANKIKSKITPWNVLRKMNASGIAKRMKDIMNKYIVPDANIQTQFYEKKNYMLGETDTDVPIEHDISKWHTFLPPLVPIVTEPHDVTEYTKDLIAVMKSNKHINNRQLSNVQSGLIHFPMLIISEIQKVVQKELPLLTNISQEAFLENACCIDDDEDTTINYFMKRIPALRRVNDTVKKLHSIYRDVNDITMASRIFSPVNTRRVYPKLSTQFSDKTVYKAIIENCNFGTLFPIPENFQIVCFRKPENFSLNGSLEEQIATLKYEGLNFTLEQLNKLMGIINRENTIHISLYDDEISTLEKMRSYLNDDVHAIPSELHKKLKDLTDTFDISVTEPTGEMNDLVNYVDREIKSMKTQIVSFLQRNSKLSARKFNKIIELLQRMEWSGDQDADATNINNIDYLKNQIHELTAVFPNMIINNVNYDEITFPKHWRKSLSDRHISDIYNIIKSYYSPLSKYNDNEIIEEMLQHITNKTQIWRDFIDVLPIFERIEKKGHIPSLNTKMVNQLLQYALLQCISIFVKHTDPVNDDVSVSVSRGRPADETFEITTMNEIVDEEIGNISEMDIISGEKLERSELMVSFILDVFTIFNNTKRLLNYTYEDIIYRVNVSKEKEKDQFTKRLKELTDEERDIENQMKGHKLGIWSKGLSKGVTQYERDNYDQERKEMETIIEMERTVGKHDFVSDMNRDIFISETAEAARVAAQIEAEESRIDYMGEDADYEEMGMDGDEFY